MKKRIVTILLVISIIIPTTGCNTQDLNLSSVNSILSSNSSSSQSPSPSKNADGLSTASAISKAVNSSKISGASTNNASISKQKISVNINKKIAPMTSEDTEQLNKNPDRGFRYEIHVDVGAVSTAKTYEDMKSEMLVAIDKRIGMATESNIKVAQSYLELNVFKDTDITSKGLQAIEAYFDGLKLRGLKAQVRFIYELNIGDVGNAAKQPIILRHIDQLTPLLVKRKNDIQILAAGFLGPWGEWHHISYPVNEVLILKTIAEKLLPNGIYLTVRQPAFKNYLKGHPAYNRIAIANDAFFGMDPTAEMGGPILPGTQEWKQMIKEGAYTPQDGELFWTDPGSNYANKVVDGYKSIVEMSEHRYSTFSGHHGNWDGGQFPETKPVMQRWREQPLTTAKLKQLSVIGSPNWFKNKNGGLVNRNVYDFIRSNLGYYIEMQNINVSGESRPGGSVQANIALINYGFAAAFNMRSGFAILDANNNVVSTLPAGNPATWYNRSPENYSDSKVLTHDISLKLKLPTKSGQYKLAFYLKNDRGEFARIANNIECINGYHILHSFEI